MQSGLAISELLSGETGEGKLLWGPSVGGGETSFPFNLVRLAHPAVPCLTRGVPANMAWMSDTEANKSRDLNFKLCDKYALNFQNYNWLIFG